MNADQKKRIAHEISNWKNACNCRAVQLTGDRMAALLQELVDAPEPEPVARVTGYYAGYLTIATVDGRVLPAGTALYLAPPAPSVPDGWKLVPVEPTPEPFGYFKAEPFGWTDCAETDDGAIALFDAPPAPIYNAPAYMATHDAWRGLEPFLGKDVPDSEVVLLSDVKAMLTTPPAPDQSEQHLGMVPADVARDAERWQMLPAFLAEFQVPYLQLVDKIDAAIEREIFGGAYE